MGEVFEVYLVASVGVGGGVEKTVRTSLAIEFALVEVVAVSHTSEEVTAFGCRADGEGTLDDREGDGDIAHCSLLIAHFYLLVGNGVEDEVSFAKLGEITDLDVLVDNFLGRFDLVGFEDEVGL